jgi:hypothetical protein
MAVMLKRAVLFTVVASLATPVAAAPSWRVQQACALQRYLRATPAFPNPGWGRAASNVSLGGSSLSVSRREDAAARAQFDTAMRSGRAFADRAAAQLAREKDISQEEAYRRIGADPGPWPQVTSAQCQALEQRSKTASR